MLSVSPCFCLPVKHMSCWYKLACLLWICVPQHESQCFADLWPLFLCHRPRYARVSMELWMVLGHCDTKYCVSVLTMIWWMWRNKKAETGNVIRKSKTKHQTPKAQCFPGICFFHTSLSCFLFIVWCHSGFTPPIPPTSRHYGISPVGLRYWRHHLIMSVVVQLRDWFLCHQTKALSLSPGKMNLLDHPGIYSWVCDSSITKVCSH